MYPEYKLQVFDPIQSKWIDNASYEASNQPHHYDILYEAFQRLVSSAKNGSANQAPIGYRIVVQNNTVVDCWTNGAAHRAGA